MGAAVIGAWLLALCLAGPARAQEADDGPAAPAEEAPWYVGLVVGQVSLEAPQGGLPRENLEPLLRLRQGDRYDPALVRQDIALLVRAGAFAAVEVDAEPWLAIDDNGEPVAAARVVYRVYPPTRIDRIDIEGARGAARRVVQAAHGLGRGEAFFPRRDGPTTERRVRDALVAEGWPQARVEVVTERLGENRLRLEVRVETGPPRLLDEVVLASHLPLEEHRVDRILRRSGLRVGKRITDAGAREARLAVRDMLVGRGYLDPRVTLLFSEDPGGGEVVAVLGETGARTEVAATGRGAPSAGRLQEIVGLQAGVRLSEGTVDDAVVALRRWYQARGWYEAEVVPRVERSGDDALLVLAVERGQRHRIVELAVEGAEGLPPETVAAALREAAPDSLGRRVLVEDSLEGAARAVREVYRGQGYLDARVDIGQAEAGRARWRPPLGRVVPLTVPVTVEEGPRTELASLSVQGASSAASERVALARQELVGQPYRPGALESLRQELVAGLRSEGFLGADVAVEVRREEQVAHADLVVQPGQQTRLRTVIIQGNSRTRRSVIARELAVEVGQPLSPQAIEETRRRLYDLDLFRVVTLELVGEDDRARDLIVRVEERPPVLLELSGGVATDRGVQARGRVAHRNLAGLGHRVSLLGQAGYAWAGDDWRLDLLSPVWRAAVRYEAPNLPARGQRLVAEVVLNEEVQEPTFRTSDIGGSLGVRVRLSERSEAFLAYGGRWRTLEDVDPGALVAGDPWLRQLGLDAPPSGEVDLREARRAVTGPSLALVLDRRDDALDPRRGWRASGVLDIRDGLFDQQDSSVRGEAHLEHLQPLGSLILALGATGGLGWAQGADSTLPVEERFYLGGSGSLRGFRPSSVGPANRVPRPDIDYPDGIGPFIDGVTLPDGPTHWVMTGGDLLAAGSIELRVPLSTVGLEGFDDTWLVGFTDVGRVSFLGASVQPTSRAEGRDPLVRYGVGGGLRLATAIGPVSLLVGANPAPLTERDESRVLVHFTLGDL